MFQYLQKHSPCHLHIAYNCYSKAKLACPQAPRGGQNTQHTIQEGFKCRSSSGENAIFEKFPWLGRIPPLWLAQSLPTAAAWLLTFTGTGPAQQRGSLSLEGKERTRPPQALLPAWTAGSSALAEQPLLLPDGLCSNLQLSPTDFLTCAVLKWQHQSTYSTLQHLGAQLPCISLQS